MDDLRAQRDEAQAACTAWHGVFESIEAHLQDRIAMRDPADPETYLRIIRSEVADVRRQSEQIVASRWNDAAHAATALAASAARIEVLTEALRAVELARHTDTKRDWQRATDLTNAVLAAIAQPSRKAED